MMITVHLHTQLLDQRVCVHGKNLREVCGKCRDSEVSKDSHPGPEIQAPKWDFVLNGETPS